MTDEARVPTNLRTLMIMEAVAQSEEPLTPTEINRSIGLPKQSIHRLCQTMLEEGFLIRDVSGKRLRPAPRALNLARGILASQNATIARRQVLNDISEATGETVNFVVPGSAAASAGVRQGNRITMVDGQAISEGTARCAARLRTLCCVDLSVHAGDGAISFGGAR